MYKEEIVQKITDCGVVAVIRADSKEQALRIAEACVKGGISSIEITFTVPDAAAVIKTLSQVYANREVLIGAGTVLTAETAMEAINAGASFIVSPCLRAEVVRVCQDADIACIPGAMTIKEVVEAMDLGADIIKIFPGELFGPAIIKAIKGPLPHAVLMPTGGVDLSNVAEWIKAGSCAVGVGSNLTIGARTGDYDAITQMANALMKKFREARELQ